MKKICLYLILFISYPCFSAGTTSESPSVSNNSDQIKILYERAEQYIEENNFKKSLKVLKSLTKREDLSGFRADIYNLLGFSYRKLNNPDLDKSFAAYMMALEIDPKHIGAHEYLGELHIMRGEKNKAIDMLNKLELLSGTSSKEYLELKNVINQY